MPELPPETQNSLPSFVTAPRMLLPSASDGSTVEVSIVAAVLTRATVTASVEDTSEVPSAAW